VADLKPSKVAPYFVIVALIHIGAVASRFDLVAARLPEPTALVIMLAQFPLLLLSGFFEGQLDYGTSSTMPRWMQINSRPVKLAFTFGFTYVALVVLQTWDISIGSIRPMPPASFSPIVRALWFAGFSLGASFPCYLASAGILIPLLRALTWPLRQLPGRLGSVLGALLALALGGALGVVALTAVQSSRLHDVIAGIQATIARDPALAIGVILATVLAPMLLGLILKRE